MRVEDSIIGLEDRILVTGASGFIGSRVVERLLEAGYKNVRCLVRPSGDVGKLERMIERHGAVGRAELFRGNLLVRQDCVAATEGVRVIYHLAKGKGEKLFADAVLNSVVTTRNLLDGVVHHGCLRRFVNIGSFAVYTNRHSTRRRVLDETNPLEDKAYLRGDSYCYAKFKQDQLVIRYGKEHGIPYVILRPGVVYGPGNDRITGRVGISTFGLFLHLGGSNRIPFTYVDNCAEAILLAGLRPGVDGEVFNIVDDDVPTSRQFLRMYKRKVRRFRSLYLPHAVSYLLCWLWEKYSSWSEGQLPNAFNRRLWHSGWAPATYSNEKLKSRLGWKQPVPTPEAFERYFQSCQQQLRPV